MNLRRKTRRNTRRKKKRKDIPFFGCPGLVILASQADVLRGSSCVPAPISRAGTRDELSN